MKQSTMAGAVVVLAVVISIAPVGVSYTDGNANLAVSTCQAPSCRPATNYVCNLGDGDNEDACDVADCGLGGPPPPLPGGPS